MTESNGMMYNGKKTWPQKRIMNLINYYYYTNGNAGQVADQLPCY